MNRQTLQCIGTSTDGRPETKESLVTQLKGVCAGEPAPNESVHDKSRPKAKLVHKADGQDETTLKATSTRCLKAKLKGTGGVTIPQVQPHRDERGSGCGTLNQPGSVAHSQSPLSTGSAPHAGAVRQMRPALTRPLVATEQCRVQVDAAGAMSASCTSPGVHVKSSGTLESQTGHQPDESGSEEEEERCNDGDEEPVRSAPLELLAEFLKAVMEKDYLLSQKLCQMILIYEPENPEAKLFMPLIEERLLIAQEAEEQRRREEDTGCSSEEDEDDDDDNDDDGSDEDDNEDSDGNDEGDDDDDDDKDCEEQTDTSESCSSSSSGEASDEEDEDEERRASEEQERCKRAAVIL